MAESAPGSTAPAAERVELCESASLADGGKAHVFDVTEFRRPARAFVLRFEGRVFGYLNRCAHVPAEMDWQPGEFFDADRRSIICSIHGATYDPRDGRCTGGPGGRGRLKALQVAEEGGRVYWYPSPDIQPLSFD
ncbi:MAG: Rieske 2Fe-2S domain-containing protein [Rubrivivax sp.]|nr:Rieske 2Fe-2S domain-containing protein [Rubrivivax sp.]